MDWIFNILIWIVIGICVAFPIWFFGINAERKKALEGPEILVYMIVAIPLWPITLIAYLLGARKY